MLYNNDIRLNMWYYLLRIVYRECFVNRTVVECISIFRSEETEQVLIILKHGNAGMLND